jgi:isocitrate dehydrogenase
VDVYVESERTPNQLGDIVKTLSGDGLTLGMISDRGVTVWPNGMPETFCTGSFRCRFSGGIVTPQQIIGLLGRMAGAGLEVVKTEYLRNFDGQPGFSQ